jgi:hypothetical protein
MVPTVPTLQQRAKTSVPYILILLIINILFLYSGFRFLLESRRFLLEPVGTSPFLLEPLEPHFDRFFMVPTLQQKGYQLNNCLVGTLEPKVPKFRQDFSKIFKSIQPCL